MIINECHLFTYMHLWSIISAFHVQNKVFSVLKTILNCKKISYIWFWNNDYIFLIPVRFHIKTIQGLLLHHDPITPVSADSWASGYCLFLQNRKTRFQLLTDTMIELYENIGEMYPVIVFMLSCTVPIFFYSTASGLLAFVFALEVTARFSPSQSFCHRFGDGMWNLCLADWYWLNRWIHFWL